MNSGYYSLRNFEINAFLLNLVFLEPLNIFLYTWRFLRELEQEEDNTIVKLIYKWFARVSILLLPAAFLCIVPAYIVLDAKNGYYFFHG
jgi:hypothetical protein